MKIKPGDILKYEVEPGNPMRIIDLVFSVEGNKYYTVALGYVMPEKKPHFWEDHTLYNLSIIKDLGAITGKIKIVAFPALKHDIVKGLFIK